MLPERLQPFRDTPIKVLDKGSVQLIDVLGDDMSIVNAARVSYGAGTKRATEDRHLVRYLMRHRHTSPFEMCEIVLRIECPIMVFRQWIRHRTASVNEVSGRYSVMTEDTLQTEPEGWREQSSDNKQGSAGLVTTWPEDGFIRLDDNGGPDEIGGALGFRHDHEEDPEGAWVGENYYSTPGEYLTEREIELHQLMREIYNERLKFGVAREQARKDLPVSTYTTSYWKCDLHNLFHFLSLRLDSHAQEEIRVFADAIAEIVKVWVPWAWEAFEDYRLNGMFLTRMEVEGLRHMLRNIPYEESTFEDFRDALLPASALHGAGFLSEDHSWDYTRALDAMTKVKNREAQEFLSKLKRILGE